MAREAAIALAQAELGDVETSRVLSASANAIEIARRHIVTLAKLREVQTEDEDNQELYRMYSVLIPGYTNESAIKCLEIASILHGIILHERKTNTQLLEYMSPHMHIMDADTAIYIAYHANHNTEDASIYLSCCAIVLDAYALDAATTCNFILEDSAALWNERNQKQ